MEQRMRVIVLLLVTVVGCGGPALSFHVHTGADAKDRILKWCDVGARYDRNYDLTLPESARNFYFDEGSTFNGSVVYWSFECDSREECLRAVGFLTGIPREELKPWKPSRYAVVMNGPGFYDEKDRTELWDVRNTKNGLIYEYVQEPNQRMHYCGIDFDRKRVYYHYESGGFPPDEYKPDSARGVDDGRTKLNERSP